MAGLDLTIFCVAAGEVDGNVYNISQSDELAAIIPGRFTYGDQLDSHNFVRDIVLVPNKGGVQRWIDDRHLLSDPLRFVFAFLSGMMGWRPRIMKCVTISHIIGRGSWPASFDQTWCSVKGNLLFSFVLLLHFISCHHLCLKMALCIFFRIIVTSVDQQRCSEFAGQ